MIKDLLAHIVQNGSQASTEGAATNDSQSNSGVFDAILSSISSEKKPGDSEKQSLNLNADSINPEQAESTIISVNNEEAPTSEQGNLGEFVSSEESILTQPKVELNFIPAERIAGQEIQAGTGDQVPVNDNAGTSGVVNPQQAAEVSDATDPTKQVISVSKNEPGEQPSIITSKQEAVPVSDIQKTKPIETSEQIEVPKQKFQDSTLGKNELLGQGMLTSEQTASLTRVSQKESNTKLEGKSTPLTANEESIVGETPEMKENPGSFEKGEVPLTALSELKENGSNRNQYAEENQDRGIITAKAGQTGTEEVSNKVSELSKTNSIGTVNSQNIQPNTDLKVTNQAGFEATGYNTRTSEPVRIESPSNASRNFRFADIQPELATAKAVYPTQEKIPEIKLVQVNGQADQLIPTTTTSANEFGNAKNPELIQVIQTHKAEVLKPKEINNQQFALSMSEQAETRLKLLVDSVRPEILPPREVPVGFISSHSMDEAFQFYNPELTLSVDQELMLKEFMTESIQGKEQKSTEQNLLGFMRLGELPVLNSTARRTLVSNFAKVLQQEVSTPVNQQEQWQKHSFKLDDGNNIDMTTRNIDGVLHIKLAASNPELNRLLQNMEQELKDHLKEELNLELDLQFENREEAFTNLMGDSSGESGSGMNNSTSDRSLEENDQDQNIGLQPSIRNFGYNQMEWTA